MQIKASKNPGAVQGNPPAARANRSLAGALAISRMQELARGGRMVRFTGDGGPMANPGYSEDEKNRLWEHRLHEDLSSISDMASCSLLSLCYLSLTLSYWALMSTSRRQRLLRWGYL